ncbi:sugar kinase [Carnimonas bestiolae]|uniref:sugar kinase n=1 Tax=Carnimonas bestiolae TaxID=3402172 RepID=UPI003EDB9929
MSTSDANNSAHFDFDVVGFGESMAMFAALEEGPLESVQRFERSIAGADSNVAAGLSRLGFGVLWYSRVGNDSLGRFILNSLTSEGIDCSQVKVDKEALTGWQIKARRNDGGDPEVEYFRSGSAASRMCTADLTPTLTTSRHLHCTGIPPALSETAREMSHAAVQRMREAGRSISFDTNLRPSLWPNQATMVKEINALAFQADWVLPGLEEGEILTGRSDADGIADFYLEQGVSEVAIKLGGKGSFYKNSKGERFEQPTLPVTRVVDTVGAGDGFAVGFISARLEGLSAEQAMLRGAWIGARQVQVAGDNAGLPYRKDLAEIDQ